MRGGVDLASISSLPGHPNEFLHVHLSDDRKTFTTLGRFNLPEIPSDQNFEGLCVQKIDGPFESAIYLGGVFTFEGAKLRFKPHPRLLRNRTFADHKIEGMELVSGIGDEYFGGWVLYNW